MNFTLSLLKEHPAIATIDEITEPPTDLGLQAVGI